MTANTDMTAIRPFRVEFPDADLADLRARILHTRWPERETVTDRSQGPQLATMRELARYWAEQYDWRRCEQRLNSYPNFVTEIDGLDVHFLHVRSAHPDALPIVISHGWPYSVAALLKVIEPLTDPTAHGGTAADAFHVVIPSLPGYGFSGKPTEPGWGPDRIGRTWAKLMKRLGYDRCVAQGGDWGAIITDLMAAQEVEGLVGIHTNMACVVPADIDNLFQQNVVGAADALANLPAGLSEQERAACEQLDNITLYWLTNTGVSSARLYAENRFSFFAAKGVKLPVAVSVFADELYLPPRSWTQRAYPNLVHYRRLPAGGHYPAWEQPAAFVDEVRTGLRTLR
ncbi:epoxide hydrolase family protein [Catellatospora sp. NPDC049111]|uniref:epoxide hydrolase family protein n=1 Tax=Catellatospora sp. NPDC049111 TaxID=3155271 RepID=UPI00340328DE